MSECRKTFAVQKGLCRATMCGWAEVSIYTPAVEDEYAENIYQRSELDWLIDHDPTAYAELVLHGDARRYLRDVTEYNGLEKWGYK